MWIISKEDKYVSSTWGASVSLKANEPKQVANDLGLLCLQHGCEEVQGGIKEEPIVKEAPIEEVIEETSKDLESMTKVELEEYGRTIGIELDRRKKKSDLIEELKKAE